MLFPINGSGIFRSDSDVTLYEALYISGHDFWLSEGEANTTLLACS